MSQSGSSVKATLYVVRHGECMANITQTALNPLTDHLTDLGKAQATLLGKHLKDVGFTRSYASDYPRTMETANQILKQSAAAEVPELKPEKRLRERDYTGLYDMPAADIITVMLDEMRKGVLYVDAEIENSETVAQFEQRIIDFVSHLIQELRTNSQEEERILLASHGLTIQRLMILLNTRSKDLGIDNWTRNLFSEKLMRNTSYHEIVLEIPRDNSPVSGYVSHAHFREHVQNTNNSNKQTGDVSDSNNYTFLEGTNKELSFEDQTSHYCKPV